MWPPSISNTLELEWLMVHTYLIHIPFATFFLVPLVPPWKILSRDKSFCALFL